MKKRQEDNIQADIVRHFTNNYCLTKHNPRCVIFSVQNELLTKLQGALEYKFKKSPTTLKIIKQVSSIIYKSVVAMGLLKGVSDLVILLPNKCIFIELKTATGKQSKSQKEFQQRVEALGFDYYIVRSLEEFKSIIYDYNL